MGAPAARPGNRAAEVMLRRADALAEYGVPHGWEGLYLPASKSCRALAARLATNGRPLWQLYRMAAAAPACLTRAVVHETVSLPPGTTSVTFVVHHTPGQAITIAIPGHEACIPGRHWAAAGARSDA